MGGSIVLNPLSSHYEKLSAMWTVQHRNEFFAPDAEVLLSNSREFISRTKILNRNAEAVAGFLDQYASSTPHSPVTRVLYPTLLPDKSVYDKYKTAPTDEFPEPGYGCLLSVDFDSIDSARTFYDHCGFYPSPHLGGHVTIMFAYNMFVFSKKEEEREYFRTLGVREECVRISVGLEDVEDLIDTIKDALKVVEASRKGTQTVAAEEKPLN
jgi:cystathionine gamma-synthase